MPACDAGSGNANIIVSDIDIQISPDYTFWYDPFHTTNLCPSGYYDFRSTIEHEFGHAIGLEHTLNVGDMMWPYQGKGDIFSSLSSNDINGATAEVALAESSLTSGCAYSPMTGISCPAGINNHEITEDMLSIFPNPFTREINLNLHNADNSYGSIMIFDITGKIVYQKAFFDPAVESNLNLSFLNPGLYILKYCSKGNSFTQKISRQ